MGIFDGIKKFFGGDGGALAINQNAITSNNFSVNDNSLYTSSLLVQEANNRGWLIDKELVQQSGLIAKNAKQNAQNIKVFGKNLKDLSKAEVQTSREMKKLIGLVAKNDSTKYDSVLEAQSMLDAQLLAHQTVRANYKKRLEQVNQRLNDSLNNTKSRRDQLKGR